MADHHMKPPCTMGHESLIQRRPSHLGWLQYFFSDIQSDTLDYHTPRLMYKGGNQDNIVEFTVAHGMVIMAEDEFGEI